MAGASKRLASRFYELKTGRCLTGQYLQWTTSRPDVKCRWCQYSIQTREQFIELIICYYAFFYIRGGGGATLFLFQHKLFSFVEDGLGDTSRCAE